MVRRDRLPARRHELSGSVVLSIPASNVDVQMTKSNYQKVAQ